MTVTRQILKEADCDRASEPKAIVQMIHFSVRHSEGKQQNLLFQQTISTTTMTAPTIYYNMSKQQQKVSKPTPSVAAGTGGGIIVPEPMDVL